MPLKPGQTIAHYRIDQKIGEGGMGEVWSATDTRLNRPAAIKALPADVVGDPERLARFNREAQLLAALSHPNIAAIYGLERMGDVPYLALELVDGVDLSIRIAERPVPIDEAVEIALQIAAALAEAHDKSIIHRDLKPANIKLAADGKVKVLDFGLAKALSADPMNSASGLDVSASPTLTAAMGTQVGSILGTAAYMAPEQARGKPVDRRADIWAFGVILFEMLTGERLFTGETATDIIAAVVTREPEWDKLPDETPTAMRRLLKRCLQKDPRKRLRDIGDAALELTEGPEEEPTARAELAALPQPSGSRVWLVGAACLAIGLAAAWGIQSLVTPVAEEAPPTWSGLPAPDGAEYDFTRFIEISPDGRRVAFVAKAPDDDEPLLWVRDLDNEQPRALAGTEGALQPFWSPDSRSIAYFAKRKLWRISADGGVTKSLADVAVDPRGGCWGADDTILFIPSWSHEVYRIPAAGGTPTSVTQFNKERLELSHRWPHMLPDGRHFLYFIVSTYPQLNPDDPSELDKSGLYIGSFDGEESRLLSTVRSRAVYNRGSLLFVDDGILMARPFDLETLSFTGEPSAIAGGVTQTVDSLWGGSLFSVSDDGPLLFVRGAPERREASVMQWFDRAGNDLGTLGEPEAYNDLRISHDGTRVATSFGDPGDVWIHDLERGSATRFTFDPGNDIDPTWSPDDSYLVFQSNRILPGREYTPGSIFRKAASGQEPEEHVASLEFAPTFLPADWSPDGTAVLLTAMYPGTGADIMIYTPEDGSIEPFLATDNDEQSARISPDGRWLAYESRESGRFEIYVQAFPGPGGKWQVSNGGGVSPVWRSDGKELFFLRDGGLSAVKVESDGGFRHDAPVVLFDIEAAASSDGYYSYDVAPGGERFLVLVQAEEKRDKAGAVTLVQGWRGVRE